MAEACILKHHRLYTINPLLSRRITNHVPRWIYRNRACFEVDFPFGINRAASAVKGAPKTVKVILPASGRALYEGIFIQALPAVY